ncbi:uncharacterized protein EI97DRAFT_50952 [Westerdykella ornata]|uniref:Uncharacterized protein n=1 Tax=Westerdykella ornata TaxID=318751 RepID=A0A6A6JHZ0_WESOR|nr:uncharacterized protein EI97DRAFT_50952 [Westerdykella ornata]KAF2276171.1 hypothetical protein EI97DRAFT_50952 [Westerdykella ornata]
MKRGLHEHLRTGLDFEEPDIQREDIVEPQLTAYNDPTERASKRQRIERIATDYLRRGKVPTLLSTRLRGPFDSWTNPWSNASSKPTPQSVASTEERRSGHGARNRRKQHLGVKYKGTHDESSERLWLKRRKGKDVERYSASPAPKRSPTPSRVRRARFGGKGDGNPAKLSSRTHTDVHSAVQRTSLGHWRSSASASMLISSPAAETPYKSPFGHMRSGLRTPLEHGISRQTLEVTHASAQCSRKKKSSLPVPITSGAPGSANTPHTIAQEEAREGDREGSEARGARRTVQADSPTVMVMKARASPGNTSSFQYRRRGGRRVNKVAQQPKTPDDIVERTASNGTPVGNSNAADAPVAQEWKSGSVHGDAGRRPHTVHDAPSDQETTVEGPRGEQQRTSLGSDGSRQSLYSTQAAMMLAQLEFQDGTFPDPSPLSPESPLSASLLPSGSQGGTPKTTLPGKSPAITPFHAFNAQLEKAGPDSWVRSAAISTQDLFLAASPFAFSTVKKQSTAVPKGSGLRFAVFNHKNEQERVADAENCRSPRRSNERLPLRERNSVVSFPTSQKGTQESLHCSGYVHSQTVELPGIDFPRSFDGDVSFADQFLRNVDGLA